jgi:hypothetical protein
MMAKTLEIVSVSDGQTVDRVTLGDGGQVTSENGLGEDMITSLVTSLGITPAEAFDMRTGWSNGYLTAKLA